MVKSYILLYHFAYLIMVRNICQHSKILNKIKKFWAYSFFFWTSRWIRHEWQKFEERNLVKLIAGQKSFDAWQKLEKKKSCQIDCWAKSSDAWQKFEERNLVKLIAGQKSFDAWQKLEKKKSCQIDCWAKSSDAWQKFENKKSRRIDRWAKTTGVSPFC